MAFVFVVIEETPGVSDPINYGMAKLLPKSIKPVFIHSEYSYTMEVQGSRLLPWLYVDVGPKLCVTLVSCV